MMDKFPKPSNSDTFYNMTADADKWLATCFSMAKEPIGQETG
jgi:hypothetical protein